MNRTLGKLIAVFLTLLVLQACRDNPTLRLRYEIERHFFQTERLAREVHFGLGLPTPQRFAPVRLAYNELAHHCYAALDSIDSNAHPNEYREVEQLAYKSATKLSQYLFSAGQFDTCQKVISQLMQDIRLSSGQLLTTHYNLGRALQAAGQWDSAIAIYDDAVSRFYPPMDDQDSIAHKLFNLPIHLYEVSLQVGSDDETNQRLALAEEYYRRVAVDFPYSPLAIAASANLARIYEHVGQYEAAIEQWGGVSDAKGVVDPTVQIRIADLTAFQLNRYDAGLEQYDNIQRGLVDDDTLLIPTIVLKKALIRLEKREYSTARRLLVELDRRYPNFYERNPAAQLAKAQSFDREGNWERAESEYRFLIENYSTSDEAMSTFLHLANHFEVQGRVMEAGVWHRRAEDHYDTMARRRRSGEGEARALAYKAELFRQKKDWKTAAEILVSVFERFPDSPVGHRALLTAARVYAMDLDDRSRADSLILVLRNTLTEVDEKTQISDL